MFIIFMCVLAVFLLLSSISLYFNIFEGFNKKIIKIRGFNFQSSSENYYKKLKLLGKSDFFIFLWCLFLIIIKLFFNDIITSTIDMLISVSLILSVFIDNYIFSKKIKNI